MILNPKIFMKYLINLNFNNTGYLITVNKSVICELQWTKFTP